MNAKTFVAIFVAILFFGASLSLSTAIGKPLAVHQIVWGFIEYSDNSWVPSGVSVTITDLNNSNSMVVFTQTAESGQTGVYLIDVYDIDADDGDTIRVNVSYGGCEGNNTVIIDVSVPPQRCDVTIYGNLPPAIPGQPSGPTFGHINTIYNYSTSTWDPDGDDIYYWFDWDDGNNSGWLGPYNSNETCTASYSWNNTDTYQIKAKAKDEHGAELSTLWSDLLNVTIVISQPPNEPSDPEPEDGATEVDINVDLSWNCNDPDGDNLTYDVYFEANDPSPDDLVSEGQTETTYDPGTMEYNTHYYWQIVAWDPYGFSSESPVWDFTTISFPNDPPYPPSDPEPEDGATDVDIDADLSWSCSDPNGDDLTYDVYFEANDPTPDELVSNNQTNTTYDPGTMEYNTHYYWQIVAWDEYGASTSGPVWDFTTEDEPLNFPPEFSNENPPDGATDVPLSTSSLSIYISDPEGDSFDWTIETSPDIGSSIDTGEHNGTKTCSISGLDYSTTYTWYVNATDSGSSKTTEEIYTFTTVSNSPPNIPDIDGPTSGKPGTSYEYGFTSIDPDGHNLAEYIVKWGDSSGEETITGPFESGEEATASHSWDEKGTYTIQAKAKDVYGAESDWGELGCYDA